MSRGKKKDNSLEREYKTVLEHFYEKHRWYQYLVFMSRIVRMSLYVLLGTSVVLFVINKGRLQTFESFVYDLVATPLGKIAALIFGILLIIYGIEKPRG